MISAFEHIQADNFDETEHLEKAASLKKRAERLAQLSFAVNLVGMLCQIMSTETMSDHQDSISL